jgi:integrase
MAWIEKRGSVFRLRFRFGGAKHLVALDTADEREANNCLSRFEEHLRLIRRGVIPAPPDGADVGVFILSGGKLTGKVGSEPEAKPKTVTDLFVEYRAGVAAGDKEETTRLTEKVHLKHLERLLDGRTRVAAVNVQVLQKYVDDRVAEPGRNGATVQPRTVKKELGTLAYVWNRWALPRGLVPEPLSTGGVSFGKERAKPPFQTRAQIERQLARGGLTDVDQARLWACLFLTLPEVEELLDFVRDCGAPRYVYPMFAFAAHTGARRSEIMRSRIDDFDLVAGTAVIREKKRETDKQETYRTVPLTPRLREVMRDWFAAHPGGVHTVCARGGRPITRQWAAELFWTVLAGSKWAVVPGWHCLRHSFISNCVAKGVDQRLVDQWVGHTTEAMRRRYSHLVPAVSQAALLSVFGG